MLKPSGAPRPAPHAHLCSLSPLTESGPEKAIRRRGGPQDPVMLARLETAEAGKDSEIVQRPLSPVGVLYSHPRIEKPSTERLTKLRMSIVDEAMDMATPRRAKQQSSSSGSFDNDHRLHHLLDHRLHLGDSSRDLCGESRCMDGLGGNMQFDFYSRVLTAAGCLRRGWTNIPELRLDSDEYLRSDGGRPILHRACADRDFGRRRLPCIAHLSLGAACSGDQNIQAGKVCDRDEIVRRGSRRVDDSYLSLDFFALHGRGAVFERALLRREVELSRGGQVECNRGCAIWRRMRRRLQSRLCTDIRPMLHRGIGAKRFSEHCFSLLVVSRYDDLSRLWRSLSEDFSRQVRRVCRYARRYGFNRVARGHRWSKVSGCIRQPRFRRS
mmetsp:Transcript_41404/g.65603  ORF Transcript_41404/g.65603 Transcript_41404/m.65603 type:complete len:383 (-) Transcript_41404:433-1581(-)